MTEKLLQFIWQFGYYNKESLTTTAKQSLRVLSPGTLNKDQGPDFQLSKILIDNTQWAGNIELHIRASDWLRHGHQQDERYNKIILHVVWINDMILKDQNGNELPTLELQDRISGLLINTYESWMLLEKQVPCGARINTVPEITWQTWKQRLLVERLVAKSELVKTHQDQTNNHWEEIFWRLLCRYFGGKVNRVSFEQLAVSLPVELLAKHRNQLHQLEALLLGQAGLLHKNFEEKYGQMLFREYQFLQKKYGLRVINLPPSFLRMRPPNFPTIRLAQMAALIQKSHHLFATIREAKTISEVRSYFDVTANDYWNYHFRFDEETDYNPKKTGRQMIDILLINAVVPMLFSYGHYTGNTPLKEKAIKWLEELPAEKNSKVKPFADMQVPVGNAFDSQAVLQLKTNYCDAKRCLECAIGNSILKRV